MHPAASGFGGSSASSTAIRATLSCALQPPQPLLLPARRCGTFQNRRQSGIGLTTPIPVSAPAGRHRCSPTKPTHALRTKIPMHPQAQRLHPASEVPNTNHNALRCTSKKLSMDKDISPSLTAPFPTCRYTPMAERLGLIPLARSECIRACSGAPHLEQAVEGGLPAVGRDGIRQRQRRLVELHLRARTRSTRQALISPAMAMVYVVNTPLRCSNDSLSTYLCICCYNPPARPVRSACQALSSSLMMHKQMNARASRPAGFCTGCSIPTHAAVEQRGLQCTPGLLLGAA